MKYEEETFFGLHFSPRHGGESRHVLPAQYIVHALEGFQRTIHLVAMMKEGQEIRKRARIPSYIEDRFQLHCAIAKKGSYIQPTFIADKGQDLLSREDNRRVAEITKELLRSMADDDESGFKRAVVDSAFRSPILRSLGKMFGGQEARYRLSVKDRSGDQIADSRTASGAIARLKASRLSPGTHTVVTGHFNMIDFKERKLSLLIPHSGRKISCIYDEEIEQSLLENARDLVQVVGTIELDEDGIPRRITDVQEIHPVNTSDIDIFDLIPENLKAKELNNLRVQVRLSEDKQAYTAKLEELGIENAAYTRSDLIDALTEELDFLWNNFARESDNNLSPDARSLKKALKKYFWEIPE